MSSRFPGAFSSKRWIAVGAATLVATMVLIAEYGRGSEQTGLRVEVGEEGFEPGFLSLPDGVLTPVTFRRTSEAACAHALVFPEINVERELPVGQDVIIDVPASVPRRLGFQCGAGPYRGKMLIN